MGQAAYPLDPVPSRPSCNRLDGGDLANMARKPGDGRGRLGGRAKGTPNKNTKALLEKAEELGVDPFEVLLRFAAGDWKGLGYQKPQRQLVSMGRIFYVDVITPQMRIYAADKACQYLYPKRKAVDLKMDQSDGTLVVQFVEASGHKQ